MPFAYYQRLNRRQRAIYRASDAVSTLELENREPLRKGAQRLAEALADEDRQEIATLSTRILNGINQRLETPFVKVKIHEVRPSYNWGELHGLYRPIEGNRAAIVECWMRTAARENVVSFRTFLRTLLHELVHHLDYELLELEDSFHTQGFFQRESSLMRQIAPS